MSKTYVLDSSAALDFLEGGPGMKRVGQLLKEAVEHRTEMLMSVAHFGEIYYHVWPEHGEDGAKQAVNELVLMSVQPVVVDMQLALKAAEIKARHKIPYVDCLAAALASLRQAILVTGDRDFEKLGRHTDILWIHRK